MRVGTKGRGVEEGDWTDGLEGHDESPRCHKWANFIPPAHAVSYPAAFFFSSAQLLTESTRHATGQTVGLAGLDISQPSSQAVEHGTDVYNLYNRKSSNE